MSQYPPYGFAYPNGYPTGFAPQPPQNPSYPPDPRNASQHFGYPFHQTSLPPPPPPYTYPNQPRDPPGGMSLDQMSALASMNPEMWSMFQSHSNPLPNQFHSGMPLPNTTFEISNRQQYGSPKESQTTFHPPSLTAHSQSPLDMEDPAGTSPVSANPAPPMSTTAGESRVAAQDQNLAQLFTGAIAALRELQKKGFSLHAVATAGNFSPDEMTGLERLWELASRPLPRASEQSSVQEASQNKEEPGVNPAAPLQPAVSVAAPGRLPTAVSHTKAPVDRAAYLERLKNAKNRTSSNLSASQTPKLGSPAPASSGATSAPPKEQTAQGSSTTQEQTATSLVPRVDLNEKLRQRLALLKPTAAPAASSGVSTEVSASKSPVSSIDYSSRLPSEHMETPSNQIGSQESPDQSQKSPKLSDGSVSIVETTSRATSEASGQAGMPTDAPKVSPPPVTSTVPPANPQDTLKPSIPGLFMSPGSATLPAKPPASPLTANATMLRPNTVASPALPGLQTGSARRRPTAADRFPAEAPRWPYRPSYRLEDVEPCIIEVSDDESDDSDEEGEIHDSDSLQVNVDAAEKNGLTGAHRKFTPLPPRPSSVARVHSMPTSGAQSPSVSFAERQRRLEAEIAHKKQLIKEAVAKKKAAAASKSAPQSTKSSPGPAVAVVPVTVTSPSVDPGTPTPNTPSETKVSPGNGAAQVIANDISPSLKRKRQSASPPPANSLSEMEKLKAKIRAMEEQKRQKRMHSTTAAIGADAKALRQDQQASAAKEAEPAVATVANDQESSKALSSVLPGNAHPPEVSLKPDPHTSVAVNHSSPESAESGEIHETDDDDVMSISSDESGEITERFPVPAEHSVVQVQHSAESSPQSTVPSDSEMMIDEPGSPNDDEEIYEPEIVDAIPVSAPDATAQRSMIPPPNLPANQIAPELQPVMNPLPVSNGVKPSEFVSYESPLAEFRGYQYHKQFLAKVPHGYTSTTYHNKIKPHLAFCPFETDGALCRDSACTFQHYRDVLMSDAEVLLNMGVDYPSTDPNVIAAWKDGLKVAVSNLRTQGVTDTASVAQRIVDFRREFLQDDTRVLNLK